MEAAVDQRRAEIHRGVVGEHAVFFLNLEALFDRGYELPRHRAAHGFVHEFESGAARQRLENDPHFGELPGTAGLLLMDVLFGQFLGESLAVRNLRLSHGAFDAEFGAHAVQSHLQVQFAHAAQDRLPRFAVGLQMQRRIGADHLAERAPEFFLFGFDLCLHRYADDGVGKTHTLENNRVGGIAQRVTGLGIRQGHQRNDVSGTGFFHRIGFLGEHFDHAADFFALAARGIQNRGALGQDARVDANERQSTVNVIDDLECQGREGLIVRALALADGLAVGIHRLDRGNIGRGGHIVDDRVEHLLHPLVLVR